MDKTEFIKGAMKGVISFIKMTAIDYCTERNIPDDQSKMLLDFCDYAMRKTEETTRKM